MILIAPLSYQPNFVGWGEDIKIVEKAGALVNIDVMDGNFCSNILLAAVVADIRSNKTAVDVHLMIERPS